MPQLDYYIFISQLSWLFVSFVLVYGLVSEWLIPSIYEWLVAKGRIEGWKEGVKKTDKFSLLNIENIGNISSFYQSSYPKDYNGSLYYKLKR